MIGANGLTLDPQGRLIVATYAGRSLMRIEKNGQRTVLADRYEGKRFGGPNDVVAKRDGAIYFTDGNGAYRLGNRDPRREIMSAAVYMWKDGKVTPAVTDMPGYNGLAFSPDEKYLYVNNSEPKKIWMRYRVQPDGSLTDAKLFYDATKDTRPGAPDGMKVDEKGNVYSTGPGGVWIFTPDGKPLGTIVMPEKSANVAWGGPDHKTLYITASSSIYRIHLNVAGGPFVRGR